ncbi:MAG: zinc-binding dehydrogenase [Capsulimonadaceae bacterium]|nr:zinc-binding dehydrogenase [Capsulimonadaceae bacterium]
MDRTIKALVFTAAHQMETRQFSLRACGRDEIVVKTRYSMVSPGTEMRVLAGKQSVGGDMPYFPLIPGYSIVGEVVEVGSEAEGWRVGDMVGGRNPSYEIPGIRATWGGHASHHIYRVNSAYQPVFLPSGARLIDYAAVELAAIAHRGIRSAAPRAGETAIVLGQGMIGSMSAAWLVAAGVRVGVADLSESRLERARQLGVGATFQVKDEALVGRIQAFTGGGADIVVESSGTLSGVRTAGSLLRSQAADVADVSMRWPRLVFQASYSDEYLSSPGRLFKGEGAVVLTPGDRTVADRLASIEAFRSGALNSSAFSDKVLPISEAASAYEGLRVNPDGYFSVVFDWSM